MMKDSRRNSRARVCTIAVTGIASCSLLPQAQAAVDFSGTTYTQNFDGLAATGTPGWTGDTTIPGWYAVRSGSTSTSGTIVRNSPDNVAPSGWTAPAAYYTTNIAQGRLGSFGGNSTLVSVNPGTERALGAIASTGGDPGDWFYALVLHNTSGNDISSVTVQYTGEQWLDGRRNSSFPAGANEQALVFSYLVRSTFNASAPAVDIATQNGNGSYKLDSDLDFSSPRYSDNATDLDVSLDGNLAANRQVLSSTIALSEPWTSDGYLILRWWDDDHNGYDHALAIDDVSVVVPEPASIALLAVAPLAMLTRRQRKA